LRARVPSPPLSLRTSPPPSSLYPPCAGEVGDLDKVKQFVKVMAFVNCVDGFSAQPKVVNGCSDFLGQVFGEKGKHARSAVGTNALPLNVPVEIEVIVEVEN
jgi:enamine deaminase RidA (YjgF/YER057c/UK114 family)